MFFPQKIPQSPAHNILWSLDHVDKILQKILWSFAHRHKMHRQRQRRLKVLRERMFFCSVPVTFGWLNAVFGVWARHRPPSVPIGVQERIQSFCERMCFHRASRLCQKECCCLPATHICATIVLFFLAQLKDHGELYIENIKSFVWLLLNYNL